MTTRGGMDVLPLAFYGKICTKYIQILGEKVVL